MKDGRTHLAHKAGARGGPGHGGDRGGEIQPADQGDTTTMYGTLEKRGQLAVWRRTCRTRRRAARATVRAGGGGGQGVSQRPDAGGPGRDGDLRGYISEPDRGRRRGRRREVEERRSSGMSRRRCTGTGGGGGGTGRSGCTASAGSWWSGRSSTSWTTAGCGGAPARAREDHETLPDPHGGVQPGADSAGIARVRHAEGLGGCRGGSFAVLRERPGIPLEGNIDCLGAVACWGSRGRRATPPCGGGLKPPETDFFNGLLGLPGDKQLGINPHWSGV